MHFFRISRSGAVHRVWVCPPALFHTRVAIISIVAANSHEIDAIKIFAKLFPLSVTIARIQQKGCFPFVLSELSGFELPLNELKYQLS